MKCVIAAVARDENRYIREWVQHHLSLGFDEITIYDNYSKIPLQSEIDKLPQASRARVRVEMEPISGNPQLSCYTKALRHYKGHAEWVAFIDIDEFIQLEKPLSDILDLPESVGALFVCWQFYNANGHEKYEDLRVMERFTQKCPTMDAVKGKSIVRVRDALAPGVHYPVLRKGKTLVTVDHVAHYHGAVKPVFRDIWINHYYTKSYEEWLEKINRGSCDSRCLKKYSEFFWYNPDLIHLYDEGLKNLKMNWGHKPPQGSSSIREGK